MSKTISTKELRDSLGNTIEGVFHTRERVTVTKKGRVKAVLVSPEDAAILDQLEALEDAADIREALLALKSETPVSLEAAREALGLELAGK